MPKTTRNKRWEHPLYKHCSCIERYGNIYTTIFGENVKAIKGLKWHSSNKNIERSLRIAVKNLKLEPGRSLHSLRKTAINYWENDLGINSYICAYMAGYSEAIRRKYYRVKPRSRRTCKDAVELWSIK
jgi:hypothetical protein